MRILILGGTGFIGGHLTRRLVSRSKDDDIIVAADNGSTGQRTISSRCRVRWLDLTKEESWDDLPQSDQIYHLAGALNTRYIVKDKNNIIRDNLAIMNNLIGWNRGGKVLFTSTSEVYHANGPTPIPVDEDYPIAFREIDDRWSYAWAKHICEGLLTVTPNWTIARLANTYGPDMSHNYVVKAQIQKIRVGRDIEVINPQDTRAFTYVSDIVGGLELLMNSEATNQRIYNLGSSLSYSILDMTERLVALTKRPIKVTEGPQGEIEHRGPSVFKIRDELGWNAQVGLHEGLMQSWKWYNR